MRTGLTKQEKTTDIWFDEKDPLIHIRTHNTDLKKRLAAYAGQYPDQCCQTDADPETGCMEFVVLFSLAYRRAASRRSSLYGAVRRKEKRPLRISNSMQPVSGSASVWRHSPG